MTIGLPVSSLINVQVSLTPSLAQFANFDSLLILGDSNVIDVHQRYRSYSTLAQVAADFGTTAPEYLAADLYFSQAPSPTTLYIGRWAFTATNGLLLGGALTPTEQLISNWTPVTNGGFHISVNGASAVNITGLSFSGQTNLNGVASVINAALATASVGATCVWTGTAFEFTSTTTGPTSTVAALTAPSAGTDISAQLLCSAGTLAYTQAGIAAETAVQCVTVFDAQIPLQWYGLQIASADANDAAKLAVAAYIEGSGNPHLYGISTSEAAAIVSPDTTSIGALLKALGYNRTFVQWSSTTPHCVAAMFGIMFTVNFAAANTTITLMYKAEDGAIGETLTQTQAATLNSNNYNYFAKFNNNISIVVNGWCASGQFIDTVWGADWLANQIQTNVFNVLLSAPKVPQTDPGVHQVLTGIAAACQQGVVNGYLAPGQWNSAGFGQIVQGSYLSKGYYIYAPPIATQPENTRQARIAPPIQVAAKLAGAIHTIDVLVNVNQ